MYDTIVYPEIESKPIRLAITYRNKWMIENADYVVAYVNHNWGGAYRSYVYAKNSRKTSLIYVSFAEFCKSLKCNKKIYLFYKKYRKMSEKL